MITRFEPHDFQDLPDAMSTRPQPNVSSVLPAASAPAAMAAPSPDGIERRASPRIPVDKPVQIRLLDDVTARPVRARMVDLSAEGIGIRLGFPLAKGREFVLVLPGAVGVDPESFRYCVVHCRSVGPGQFHVGCTLIRRPVPLTLAQPVQ